MQHENRPESPSPDAPPTDEQDELSPSMYQHSEPFAHIEDSAQTHTTAGDNIRFNVAEEELHVEKRPVERSALHVQKEVIGEDWSAEVPVTEEQVNVERRPVDRELPPDHNHFTRESFDLPLQGQEVDVERHARVTKEIEVSKSTTEHVEHVAGTVRHEELRVDGENTELQNDTSTPEQSNQPEEMGVEDDEAT